MDVVYMLVGVVCVEVAVISAGLFWYLPRAINQAFADAEAMIEEQRAAVFAQAGEFIRSLVTQENVQKLAQAAAPVLAAQLKGAAAGMIRKKSGDVFGSIIEGIVGGFLNNQAGAQGGAGLAQAVEGGVGVPPSR